MLIVLSSQLTSEMGEEPITGAGRMMVLWMIGLVKSQKPRWTHRSLLLMEKVCKN